MSPVDTLPDVEALVGGWLAGHSDVAAMDARVASSTPASMSRPWIRVTLLAPEDVAHGLEHLVVFTLQLDCYAGAVAQAAFAGRQEAWTLSARARAVLHAVKGSVGGGVVVTNVGFPGHVRVPDTTFEPARERYVLTVDVTLHALPA